MRPIARLLGTLLVLTCAASARAGDEAREGRFIKNVRRLTVGKAGEKAGETYFSPDGKQIIYQAIRDGQPYYQIYVIPAEGGEPRLVSTGKGKTTCAFFDPSDPDKFVYASTHLDPATHAPPPKDDKKGYRWDYDGSFDLFRGSFKDPANPVRLTDAAGYDAEASYSHDGKKICFTSNRDGASSIYVMDADGKNVVRVGPPAPAKGEKPLAGGGPFFMPGDEGILYRVQTAGDPRAPMQVVVTSLDGKTTTQLTRAPRMNWCPFPHPDGKKVVYAAALEGHRNFEVFLVKTDGSFREVRLTWTDGFDALPAFSPDGKKLVWTSTRQGGASDVYVADFVEPGEDAYEVQTDKPEAAPPGADHGAHPQGDKADKSPHADAPKKKNPHESSAFDPKTSSKIKGSEGPQKAILGADHVEELGLLQDVRWLADPAREGRRAGTAGESASARYVRARFESLGVGPGGPDGSYEQTYPILAGAKLDAAGCSFGLEDHAMGMTLGKQWQPLLYSGNGEAEGELVFCGYGIDSKEHSYDDYLTVDLKGKIAVIFNRAPQCDKGGAFGAEHPTMLEDLRFKVTSAKSHGAVAVLFVKTEGDSWLELGYGDPGIPVAQISRSLLPVFAASTESRKGIDLDAERKLIDETGKPRSKPMGRQLLKAPTPFEPFKARIKVSVEKVTAVSRNVVGRIEGTEPGREVVVIGAHVDHLGHGGDGSLAPGSKAVHPGADDNASGTSGLMALARALKARPLKRTVLLVAFGGEEMGLLGSSWFVKHSPVALDRMTMMLNMDMIGRLGKDPLVVGGTGTAKEWPKVLDAAAHAAGIDIALSKDGFGPSDHASFYGKSVPVLFLFTRSHADYHKPSDTADKIDGPGIERVVRFALATLRETDALAARPTYEKSGTDPHSQGVATGERGPWFGSVPDYGEGDEGQTDGVKLAGVREGSPAEKAGLKAGDRIVEFDGRPIKNIYDYTYAIRGGKAGKVVKVVVVREGKRIECEAALVER